MPILLAPIKISFLSTVDKEYVGFTDINCKSEMFRKLSKFGDPHDQIHQATKQPVKGNSLTEIS